MELSLALNLALGLWPGAAPSTPARAGGATSVTRTFTASDDTWIDDANQTTNYGTATTMSVVKGGTNKRGRSLARFDLLAVPDTATVSVGTLSLTQTATVTGRTLGAHKVTTSWAEGTATWSSPWTTAGGDFNATATGTATTTATPSTLSWTVTTDVSSFVATNSSNFGWLIKDGTEANPQSTVSTFNTDEAVSSKPSLSATFTAVWDSYSDSGRTAQNDSLTAANQEAVYMRGTGFKLGGTYVIAYYDSTGFKACTDNQAAVSGTLDSSCRLVAGSTLAAGTWHAVVFDPSGSAATTYASISETVNKPLADDTFTVNASALVPELPSLLATAVVMALAAAIYTWSTRRPFDRLRTSPLATQGVAS
ncbi:MAG: DNRLRE domain-containing protein [Chloroflexi bacterium]|nr:DNRLRE domain-containing protein [Chloroflexota bacterium]